MRICKNILQLLIESVEKGVEVCFCEKVQKCSCCNLSLLCQTTGKRHVQLKQDATAHSCVRYQVSWKDIIDLDKGNQRKRRSMQHMYTETQRLVGQYRQLLKDGTGKQARVLKP